MLRDDTALSISTQSKNIIIDLDRLRKTSKYIFAVDSNQNSYYLLDITNLHSNLAGNYFSSNDAIAVRGVSQVAQLIKMGYHIDNLLGTKSYDYWYDTVRVFNALNRSVIATLYVGLYLPVYNTLIDLLYCVTCDFVPVIDNIYSRLKNKEFLTTEDGYGAYNPSNKVFHFASYSDNYMYSFSLGTSIGFVDTPELEMYVSRGFARTHLNKYGLCITRLKKHSKKNYSTDITFFSK